MGSCRYALRKSATLHRKAGMSTVELADTLSCMMLHPNTDIVLLGFNSEAIGSSH